jgi:hypothetical protein
MEILFLLLSLVFLDANSHQRRETVTFPTDTRFCFTLPAAETLVRTWKKDGPNAADARFFEMYVHRWCSSFLIPVEGTQIEVVRREILVDGRRNLNQVLIIEIMMEGARKPLFMIYVKPLKGIRTPV